jgi:hypothetical protein
MRAAGHWAVAGALVLLTSACSDDDVTGAPTAATGSSVETTATAPVSTMVRTTAATITTTVPTTTVPTTTMPTSPRASFPDDAAAIDGVAAGFTYAGSPVSADVAHCIGDGLVHVFGHSRVEQLGFGIGGWTLIGFSVALGPWNRPDSTAVVDTFRVCSPDWEALMITSAASGAERLSATSTQCVAAALPDDRSRELFITLLDRPVGPELPAALAELSDAYASCLSPAELTTLDWDERRASE